MRALLHQHPAARLRAHAVQAKPELRRNHVSCRHQRGGGRSFASQSYELQARAPFARWHVGTRDRAAEWTSRTGHSTPRGVRRGEGLATCRRCRRPSRLLTMACPWPQTEARCSSTGRERPVALLTRSMTTQPCCLTIGGQRLLAAGEAAASLSHAQRSGNLRRRDSRVPRHDLASWQPSTRGCTDFALACNNGARERGAARPHAALRKVARPVFRLPPVCSRAAPQGMPRAVLLRQVLAVALLDGVYSRHSGGGLESGGNHPVRSCARSRAG